MSKSLSCFKHHTFMFKTVPFNRRIKIGRKIVEYIDYIKHMTSAGFHVCFVKDETPNHREFMCNSK